MLTKVAKGLLSALMLLGLLLQAVPVAAQDSEDAGESAAAGLSERLVTITYEFPRPHIEEILRPLQLKNSQPLVESDVSVTMEGLPQWSQPGLPVLPLKTARVLLPYGFGVESITVTGGNKVILPGSYKVEAGQEPVPLSHEGPVELTPPDPEVYGSSAPYPGKLYSGETVQSKSGYRILVVNLHPVEYIPKWGQLSYYESLTLTVTLRPWSFAQCDWRHVRHVPEDEEMVRRLVDNPEATKTYRSAILSTESSSLLEPGDYEYVIITNEALAATPGPNNFQALRDEKFSRGINATIVTTEWIYVNYPGTRPDGGEDCQTKIRNFIIDAYSTWGTTYVLLGGDGDAADVGGESGDDIIPARGFDVYGTDIAADMYYACLDGTFDYDADGIYGEPNDGPEGGEVDLFAEVYVGRAPVDSQEEVQNFVAKTLAYQSTPITDPNLRKVWMVGEYLGFGGLAEWGGNYKDEIKEGSSAHGYTTVGFEDSVYAPAFDVSTLYDRDYPGQDWPPTEIIGIINDNAHLINHLGHANVGYVMKMVNSNVDSLTNDELYFIGYSQGCYSGSFDNRDDSGYCTDYDCISEHLTTQPHGAVAFIANSRYGWGVGYSTDGPSQHYDREFWDAVLGEDILNIGIANQDSKEDNAGLVGYGYIRWCYYEINLFGDPELTLKLYEGVTYDSHEIDDSAGGNNNGYPEPGESIVMPVKLKNTSTNTTFSDVSATLSATTLGATLIFFEDFEGNWPGEWIVGDQDLDSGEDYWGQSNYRAYGGGYSAYCAEVSDVPGQYYDNNMVAVMLRNVDLSAYRSATLSYKYWLDSEKCCDGLLALYFDGTNYWGKQYLGNSGGWVSDSIEVPPTAIQVGFAFVSDGSVTYEGAYIDDVALISYSYAPDPYITISDDYEEYGDILAGGVATSLDAYDFTIAPACPIGHVTRFNLDITAANGGPWTSSFDVRIEGPDLIIADKWEEWVDENAGAYTVHYIVKNQGCIAASDGHKTGLVVDGVPIESDSVPEELHPGGEYEGAFDTIVALSEGIDEVTVCADVEDIIEELDEENNCCTNTVLRWNEFITDPVGDQFYGYGPDIVGADFQVDETTIYFRLRTSESINPDDTVNLMWLDLDLNPSTGFVSDYPYQPTNDIGADAVAFIYPAGYSMAGKKWLVPLRADDKGQPATKPPQTLSPGLHGELYFWDPYLQGFYYVGEFSVFTDTEYFWFAIPLNILDDDGIMSVVDVMGSSYEPTDFAPNDGHGITGEGPDLIIADKWEEWVDKEAGTYTVHYVVKNQGNVVAPAGSDMALIVDGNLTETRPIPEELNPNEEYQDAFSTIVSLTPPDEITVCADFYDVVDELSEDNNCLSNMLFKDIVRLTSDPDYDYSPAITEADDGTVWVVWNSGRSSGNGIWYKTSSDGGESWSEDSPVDLSGMWGYDPAVAQTDDGKIWVAFYSWQSGNGDIWYTTSSDGGASWSYPSQLTTDLDSDCDPAITQTDDGKIWVAWYSYRSGEADIWYKTSADGGETWSPDYQLTTDPSADYDPAITQTADGAVWVVWQSYRPGGDVIWYKTSGDGGETWSGDSPINLGGMWGNQPAIAQTDDGTIWVAFYSWQSGNADIWYTASLDGGASWLVPQRFTRFVGGDWGPAATALTSGQLALAWESERFHSYDIWYGVIGFMEDINPPPYLYWAEHEPVGPEAGEVVTIRASVRDESGIADVQLVWRVDGEPQEMLPMHDDGAHNDYDAGDGVYGVQIGPFYLIGTVVEYQTQIMDTGGNVVNAPQYPYRFEILKPFEKTADILLVADESYYWERYYQYYAEALDNLGCAYDVWDCYLRGNIDRETLNQYVDGVVIWATPDWGYIGNSETWDNLASYLDNGGKLFISGQDIGSSISWSWFYQDYLHAQYVQDDIGLYCLEGVPGDPITDGLYVCISGDYGANNQYSPDEIDPISPAETIFFYDPEATAPLVPLSEPMMTISRKAPDKYLEQRRPGTGFAQSSGSGALRIDTGVYKLVYFSFGFEAINSAADRATVMQRVLDWLRVPAAEDWRVPMSIAADVGSADITFGVHSWATDGYDEEFDYPAPPSPMQGIDAYFYYPDNPEFVRRLATSIVAPADSIVWPLKVMYKTEFSALQSADVTISWSAEDIANVPAQYLTLTLTDEAGQELANMRIQSSYTFQAEANQLYHFQIKAGRLMCLELKAGWNMVSLPLQPGTTDPAQIFPGAKAIYTWNNEDKRYDRPTEILPGKGHWVLYFEDVTLCLGGTAFSSYELSRGAGWHMIGGLSTQAEIIVHSGTVYNTLYHWDPQTQSYIGRPLNDVRPGEGYWLLAFTDFSISVVPKA